MDSDSKDKEYAARFRVLLKRNPILSLIGLVLSFLEEVFGAKPVDSALENQVRAAHFQALLKHPPLWFFLGLALCLSVTATLYLWGVVQYLVVWLACKLLTLGIWTAYVSWLGKQVNHADSVIIGKYYVFLFYTLALDGFVWGALVWAVTPLSSITAETMHINMVTVWVLLLVTTTRGYSLALDTKALLAFIVPMMLPNFAAALYQLDKVGMVTAAVFATIVLLNAIGGWQSQRRYLTMLRLRFESEKIIEEKTKTMEQSRIHGEARTRFLAAVSHEMRTPLHGILGLTRVLMQERPSLHQQKNLALIEKSGEHLLTVINDILDFSKIESGRMTLDLRPFDLNSLILDVVSVFQVLGQRKGITVSYETAWKTQRYVIGDAGRVRQILNNLLGNAVKFTSQGRVHMEVSSLKGDNYSFTIQDTGQGIAIDQMPFIFEPFMQAHNASLQQHGGTGLGLSIAKEMCLSMGGDLVCSSLLGYGTTFIASLCLPCDNNHEPPKVFEDLPNEHGTWMDTAAIEYDDLNTQSSINEWQAASRTIVLLAEDNPVNVMLAQAMLEKLGFIVYTVNDGQQALDWLEEQYCDVVLMDCSMPVMNGIEATRRIRQREQAEKRAYVPIVAVTANNMTDEHDICLKAGMDYFLPKPFDEASLGGSILRAIRNAALIRAS